MTSISLVSLNVERKKNLGRIIPFLRERKPDVVCFQEVCGSDISSFSAAMGAIDLFYVPVTSQRELTREINEHGVCILSRYPLSKKEAKYYVGNASHLPVSDEKIPETFTSGQNRMVAFCDVETSNITYRIGTTHFTWTPKGEANDLQRRDIRALLSILEKEHEFVLTGDFNAPRGGEIFSRLAEKYKDNIPAGYKTSLDLELHRAAKERRHEIENKMVDGLFTTPEYVASGVELLSGVSDHCAVIATIQKT